MLTLKGAELDETLRDYGIDSSDMSPRKKRESAREQIFKRATVGAMQSVSGLRVLKTFEDLDNIGVLVICSDNLRKWANAAFHGHTVARSSGGNPAQSIREQVRKIARNGDEGYMTVYGVRTFHDTAGNRAFVSFGQWSPAVTRIDSKLKRNFAVKAAREQARLQAYANLTDFVNSTLHVEIDGTVEEVLKITEEIYDRRRTEESESLQIGAEINRSIKQHGRATLQGVATLDTWMINHPETRHLICGHIVMWSPATRDAVIHGLKRNSEEVGARSRGTKKSHKGKNHPSRTCCARVLISRMISECFQKFEVEGEALSGVGG